MSQFWFLTLRFEPIIFLLSQLVNIAGDPNHCFGVDEGFAALEKVIDPVSMWGMEDCGNTVCIP